MMNRASAHNTSHRQCTELSGSWCDGGVMVVVLLVVVMLLLLVVLAMVVVI